MRELTEDKTTFPDKERRKAVKLKLDKLRRLEHFAIQRLLSEDIDVTEQKYKDKGITTETWQDFRIEMLSLAAINSPEISDAQRGYIDTVIQGDS